jgi:hypothetical protein
MDDQSKRFPFPMVGDADPIPAGLFVAYPEQATTLALLYEVSRELTSILDREELLRRVAQRVKTLVNYHVFSVMLWSEKTQRLESVFAMRYGDTIPARMSLPLHQGLTGTAAGERRILRVNDTLEDPRYIKCARMPSPRSLRSTLLGHPHGADQSHYHSPSWTETAWAQSRFVELPTIPLPPTVLHHVELER